LTSENDPAGVNHKLSPWSPWWEARSGLKMGLVAR
jgi:hypothetical protein